MRLFGTVWYKMDVCVYPELLQQNSDHVRLVQSKIVEEGFTEKFIHDNDRRKR